jgi:hypothetical protein
MRRTGHAESLDGGARGVVDVGRRLERIRGRHGYLDDFAARRRLFTINQRALKHVQTDSLASIRIITSAPAGSLPEFASKQGDEYKSSKAEDVVGLSNKKTGRRVGAGCKPILARISCRSQSVQFSGAFGAISSAPPTDLAELSIGSLVTFGLTIPAQARPAHPANMPVPLIGVNMNWCHMSR